MKTEAARGLAANTMFSHPLASYSAIIGNAKLLQWLMQSTRRQKAAKAAYRSPRTG